MVQAGCKSPDGPASASEETPEPRAARAPCSGQTLEAISTARSRAPVGTPWKRIWGDPHAPSGHRWGLWLDSQPCACL